MENFSIFQIDWLKGDPDDVELFRFSVGPVPSLAAHCYLQACQIENCLHLLSQFLLNQEKPATCFTFNSFEKSDAGGAVELCLSRGKTQAELRLTLIDAKSKYAGLPAKIVLGELIYENITTFVDGLKGINAGTVTPAALHFRCVNPDSAGARR